MRGLNRLHAQNPLKAVETAQSVIYHVLDNQLPAIHFPFRSSRQDLPSLRLLGMTTDFLIKKAPAALGNDLDGLFDAKNALADVADTFWYSGPSSIRENALDGARELFSIRKQVQANQPGL